MVTDELIEMKDLLQKMDKKLEEQRNVIDSLYSKLDRQDEAPARHTELLETIS